jgi:hypothetical protein
VTSAIVTSTNTWVGGAMIFSAVTYIAIRERKVKGVATRPATAPEAATLLLGWLAGRNEERV